MAANGAYTRSHRCVLHAVVIGEGKEGSVVDGTDHTFRPMQTFARKPRQKQAKEKGILRLRGERRSRELQQDGMGLC